MKISELISELQNVQKEYGDIDVALQDKGENNKDGMITGFESFFVVPEEYEIVETKEKEVVCNIRTWPY